MTVLKPAVVQGTVVLIAAGCCITQASAADRRDTDASAALPHRAHVPAAPTEQALQEAVALVVAVALTQQFDGKTISVDIDSYDQQASSGQQRIVTGRGSVDIGEDNRGGIAFAYRTLYDMANHDAGYPVISMLGVVDGDGERSVPNDAALVRELDERITAQLRAEADGASVRLQFDEISSFESAGRYLRISAEGIADFGKAGSSPALFEGKYDKALGKWLRVRHDLRDGSPAQ